MSDATLRMLEVTKRYGSGATEVTAVRRVSLSIEPGEVVLIMGPSGSGKTTLLLMLGALLRPSEGSIVLNGRVISRLSEGELPAIRLRQFGFIFQDFNLLSALTALENVALVASLAGHRNGEARRKAQALLTRLGLADRLNFADEPTANLDSKIGHEIMRLLRSIAKEQGRSVVIVSHDQRIKDIADRVLWLEDGEFKEMTERVVDPVCGMSIERERAAASLEVDGATFYFCSKGCRAEYAESIGVRGPLAGAAARPA